MDDQYGYDEYGSIWTCTACGHENILNDTQIVDNNNDGHLNFLEALYYAAMVYDAAPEGRS